MPKKVKKEYKVKRVKEVLDKKEEVVINKDVKQPDDETKTDIIKDTITYINSKNAKIKSDDRKVEVIRASQLPSWEMVRTHIPSFDMIYGGIPKGKYSLIYGEKSTGKTTLVNRIIASHQRLGLRTMLCPSEGVYDKTYMTLNGIDLNNLLIMRVNKLGLAGEALVDLASEKKIDLFVFDSITMMLPEEMDGKRVDEDDMALDARRISRMCKKLTDVMARNNVSVVIVCQVRSDLGGSKFPKFSGGNVLYHMPTYIVRTANTPKSYLRREGKFLDELKLKSFSAVCEKSKTMILREGKHSDSSETPYMFFGNTGLDVERTLFEYALAAEVLNVAGATYTFVHTKDDGTKEKISEVGELKFIDRLRSNKEMLDKLVAESWRTRVKLITKRTNLKEEFILGDYKIY